MQSIDPDTAMSNMWPLSHNPCDQWWPTNEPALPSLSHPMDPAGVYAQDESQFQDESQLQSFMSSDAAGYLIAGLDTIPSTQHYPDPASKPASTSPVESPMSFGTADDRHSSSSSHLERKRKRQTAGAPVKSRRGSSKSKPEGAAVATRACRKSQKQQDEAVSPQQHVGDNGDDQYTRCLQERNRIASNKFRVKKSEDAKRLKTDEEDLERINKGLTSCVADLTLQVYQLKMRLLKHTDCDCSLIQNYIASEANRYIKDMGTGQQQ